MSSTSGEAGPTEAADRTQNALAANSGKDYLGPPLSHHFEIPNQNQGGFSLGPVGRVLVLLWSFFLIAGFSVASWLEPDPRGFGTHQGLGFPPCSIRLLFGIPCPSCGMTTSFSHFTRGQFVEASRANLAGFLMASFCAVQIPWCWASSFQGRLWGISRPEIVLLIVVLILSIICLTQWLANVLRT
ncbi:MAG: DUF2752 domain-containing protein [Planctomycetaceae bacterium]